MVQAGSQREVRCRIGWRKNGRSASHDQLNVSLQLARFDCMREFKRRSYLTQLWICWILVKLGVRNRDRERRRLRFITQPLHQDLRREEFFVEDDSKFSIGRPILSWIESQLSIGSPRPRAADLRFDSDTFE